MEQWKDIPWYEWFYQIDIFTQNIKSLSRKHHFWYIKEEKILKPHIRKDWYHTFTFSKLWKSKIEYLHRLVMAIKEWPCPEWMEVCHNDWNPRNNHPDNLRYDTRVGNVRDMWKHWKGFEIKNTKRTNKKCYVRDLKWNEKVFISAKQMANYLWIKDSMCTYLIRTKNIYRWNYKWYYFSYL